MAADPGSPFTLTLGDVLRAAGVDPADVLVIRHTYKPDGMPSRAEASLEMVLDYTRVQHVRPGKTPAKPPRWWLIFIGRGRPPLPALHRARQPGAVLEERTPYPPIVPAAGVPLRLGRMNVVVPKWALSVIAREGGWESSGRIYLGRGC